jgi:predicted metal-dependent peptidase
MNKSVSKTEVAMTRMILNHPFFASLLLQHPLKPNTDIPTARCFADGAVEFNPNWFEDLTIEEIIFVLAHEKLHYLCMHNIRRNGRDHAKWNMSGDKHINPMLVASGVGKMPKCGLWLDGGDQMTTEAIYDLEPETDHPTESEEPPEGGDQPCEDGEDGEGPVGEGGNTGTGGPNPDWGIGEDVVDEELSHAEQEELEERIRVECVQAEAAAKQMGKMPGPLVDFVAKLVSVKTPWYAIMERFARAQKPNDMTFDNLDRRFIDTGDYLPFESGQGMGEMALVIDCSGSTISFWNYFLSHFNTILESVKPEKLHVVYTTTQVVAEETFTSDEYPIEISIPATGGTYMPAGVDHVIDTYLNVACMVVLTDGYTDFGWPSPVPVLWGITEKQIVSPHGETVHIDIND